MDVYSKQELSLRDWVWHFQMPRVKLFGLQEGKGSGFNYRMVSMEILAGRQEKKLIWKSTFLGKILKVIN